MTPRTYASPEAFKQALEQRLRSSAKTGAEFARKRQLLVFDRFLARIVAVLGDAATLKGGLVLELRLERARTTKDVDLRMVGSPLRARKPPESVFPRKVNEEIRNIRKRKETGAISILLSCGLSQKTERA